MKLERILAITLTAMMIITALPVTIIAQAASATPAASTVKLSTPSVTLTPNLDDGGLNFSITDPNTAGVASYTLQLYTAGGTLVRTYDNLLTTEGTFELSSTISIGTLYIARVKAKAKSSAVGGKTYADSDYSSFSDEAVATGVATSLLIYTQPTKLAYMIGSELDLSGLKVKLYYEDETGREYNSVIPLSLFDTYGITTSPAHGATITPSLIGTKVTVYAGDISAQTSAIVLASTSLETPSISLATNTTSGGLSYTITDKNSPSAVSKYVIYIYSTSNTQSPVYTYETKSKTGVINTSAEIVGGQSYVARVKAVASAANEADSELSALSNSAVAASSIKSIRIVEPFDTDYSVGSRLNLYDLCVIVTYLDNTAVQVWYEGFYKYGITVSLENGIILTSDYNGRDVIISCGSISTSFELDVSNNGTAGLIVKGITVKNKPDTTVYEVGDYIDYTGLVVELSFFGDYSPITHSPITYSPITVAYPDFDKYGITLSLSTSTKLTDEHKSVTVKCTDPNSKTTKFDIKVVKSEDVITKIEIADLPKKLYYDIGDKLDLSGLVVNLTYRDGRKITGVSYVNLSTYDVKVTPAHNEVLAAGTKKVTLSFGKKASASFTIYVGDLYVTNIKVKAKPTKTVYTEGETLNLSGLVVTLTYINGTTLDVPFADFSKHDIKWDKDRVLTPSDTVAYVWVGTFIEGSSDNVYTTIPITVKPKEVTSIAIVTQPKLSYYSGDTLDLSKLTIKIKYADRSSITVSYKDFKSYGIKTSLEDGIVLSKSTHNGQTIAITYRNITVNTNKLSVVNREVKSIAIISSINIEYYIGDNLDLSGLIVKLTYDNGNTVTVPFSKFDEYDIKTSMPNGKTLTTNDNYKTITISCGSAKQYTEPLIVKYRTLVGLKIGAASTHRTVYRAGERFDSDKLVLTASYSDGSTKRLSGADIVVSPIAALNESNKYVTAYFTDPTGITMSVKIDIYVYAPKIYDVIIGWNNPFTDVKQSDWYYQYAAYMNCIGVMNGTSTTKFSPSESLTRGMFVTMLYRIAGSPSVTYKGIFKDVSKNDYYANAIEWAYSVGITTGTSATQFSPGMTLTREQMITFLYRFAKYYGYNVSDGTPLTKFPDAGKISAYALDAFKWAYSKGLINERDNGYLEPTNIATRAEAAKGLTIFHINYAK